MNDDGTYSNLSACGNTVNCNNPIVRNFIIDSLRYWVSDYPELSWHGERPWEFDRSSPFLTFGFMYSEPAKDFGTGEDCFIYCAYNSHWEDHTFEMSIIPAGMRWSIVMYSADEKLSECGKIIQDRVTLTQRSSMIHIGKKQ